HSILTQLRDCYGDSGDYRIRVRTGIARHTQPARASARRATWTGSLGGAPFRRRRDWRGTVGVVGQRHIHVGDQKAGPPTVYLHRRPRVRDQRAGPAQGCIQWPWLGHRGSLLVLYDSLLDRDMEPSAAV